VRVLVIGGTRFIGPPVVARLVELGNQVTVFHRGETEADLPPDVRHVHADRAKLAELRDAVRGQAPDVLLDMAPLSAPDAQAVVDAARGEAGRLVAISSMDVYRAYGRFHGSEPGPPDPMPFDEDAPLRERLYPYRGENRGLDDYDKVLVERIAMGSAELPATVLRLPMVYGPGDHQHRLFFELKRMDDGRPAILLDEVIARWRWTRGYVENVADAIALATTDARAAGRVYNAGEPEALTSVEWVEVVGRAAGWRGRVLALPAQRMPAHLRHQGPDYAQDLVADTGRIRRELGYAESVSRDEGLRRAIAWERAHRRQGDLRWFDYEAEDAALAALD
jgi:nucleoside-diphosphate-sugar epimerase